jgi:hypothetical protein
MLIRNALKDSTRSTYTSAQKRYLRFCESFSYNPLPTCEETMLGFVSFLFSQGLKGTSISVYVAAVRSLHDHCGLLYPDQMPRLKLAMRGSHVLSDPPVRKLPITFSLLCKILGKMSYHPAELVIQLAMCVSFFGCLRAGEVCVPDGAVFDEKRHLCVRDVQVFSEERMFSLTLRQSKTDRLGKGVVIYIGCSHHVVCAYCLMLTFLERKSDVVETSPLFADAYIPVLRKSMFVNATRLVLSSLGLDPSKYSGHSFRAGSATSGADSGFNPWELKMLGRWSSECYNIYLRNPKVVSNFAQRLASSLS